MRRTLRDRVGMWAFLVGAVVGCRAPAPAPFIDEAYDPTASPALEVPVPARLPADAEPGEPECDLRTCVQLVMAPDGSVYRLSWWAESESVGSPQSGTLRRAARLPRRGVGYRHQGRHPFGTYETVAYVRYAAAWVAERYPGTVPVVVQDLSAERGGRLPPHRSHRSGRDVDIGWYATGNRPLRTLEELSRADFDAEKTWAFVEALLRTGAVQYVFVDRRIQEWLADAARSVGFEDEDLRATFQVAGNPRAPIRHVRGHVNHMHVRFRCPVGDNECVP